MEPGVYKDIDIEQYHSGQGISKSGLDLIARSPAHYYALSADPNRPPAKERGGQLEGALAHCAVLEPEEFSNRYVVLPDDAPRRLSDRQRYAKEPSKATIEAISWWDEFEAKHKNKTVITKDQFDVAISQSKSVRRISDIAQMLETGDAESSAYWTDPVTGVLCRCRPDFTYHIDDKRVILLDLKTYSSASPAEFSRQIARKRYHVQDAFYTDGYQKASKKEVLGFIFVAVEMEYPYMASAVQLDSTSKSQGRADYRKDLDLYAHCLKNNSWPAWEDGINNASLPNWALTDVIY